MLGLLVVTVWTVQQPPSTARAASASLVQVTNFGTNPTGLQMWLYVPTSVKPHPSILLALHYCTGSGPAFFSGTEFANLADQYGFIIIFPSVTRSGQCWDVYSNQGLARNGGSDNTGLISMLTYVEQHNNGDPNNVYVTGASSGAMMTNVMLAEYPDVFKAGSAFMGVPYHCFATGAASATSGSTWNSACANGQTSMTPQQWGDLARAADPGYNGARPRMQLWHGTADTTLNYANFGEEIKQWTNVLGVSQTPSFTDSPQSGWTRTRYGSTGVGAPVEGVSVQGVGHSLPLGGMAAYAIQFMGLNGTSAPTPTPTVGRTPTATVGTTPTPTPTVGGGSTCSVHYAVTNQWSGGFGASVTINNTGTSTINGWSLKWTFPDGQTISQIWNASDTQSGGNVTATNLSYNGTIASGGNTNFGFNGAWNGSNTNPSAFTLNGVSCTVA
jgi:poly(hydroxyalkanoate) depolymerase family esterase